MVTGLNIFRDYLNTLYKHLTLDDVLEHKGDSEFQWFPVFDYACECRDGDIW